MVKCVPLYLLSRIFVLFVDQKYRCFGQVRTAKSTGLRISILFCDIFDTFPAIWPYLRPNFADFQTHAVSEMVLWVC